MSGRLLLQIQQNAFFASLDGSVTGNFKFNLYPFYSAECHKTLMQLLRCYYKLVHKILLEQIYNFGRYNKLYFFPPQVAMLTQILNLHNLYILFIRILPKSNENLEVALKAYKKNFNFKCCSVWEISDIFTSIHTYIHTSTRTDIISKMVNMDVKLHMRNCLLQVFSLLTI